MGSEAVLFHSPASTPHVAQQHFLDLGSTKCTRYSTDQFPLLAEPSPDAFVIGTLHRHVCTHLVTYSAHTFFPFFLEKGLPYTALVGLELAIYPWMASKSEISLLLPSKC